MSMVVIHSLMDPDVLKTLVARLDAIPRPDTGPVPDCWLTLKSREVYRRWFYDYALLERSSASLKRQFIEACALLKSGSGSPYTIANCAPQLMHLNRAVRGHLEYAHAARAAMQQDPIYAQCLAHARETPDGLARFKDFIRDNLDALEQEIKSWSV